jgi:hypothetical protein
VFDKRAWRVCRRDVFECPPGTWLSALARALGNLMGSHGGIWAIGPSAGTAPAARPPLVGLLWGGSSWTTIYRCDSPNEDVQARLPECGLRLPKVVDMEQGAAQRHGMVVRISGDGLRDNSGDGLRVKPSPR